MNDTVYEYNDRFHLYSMERTATEVTTTKIAGFYEVPQNTFNMRYTLGALDYSAGDTIAAIHTKVAASIAACLNGFAEVNSAYEFSSSGATITASKKAGTTADLSFEYRAQSVYVNTSYKLDITDEATNSLTLKYFNPVTNATSTQAIGTNSSAAVYKATLDVVFGQLAAGLGYAQVGTTTDDLVVTLNDAISAVPFWFEGTNIDVKPLVGNIDLSVGDNGIVGGWGNMLKTAMSFPRTFTEVTTTTNGIPPGSNARVIKKLVRSAADNTLGVSATGKTLVDMDKRGHHFIVQDGRQRTKNSHTLAVMGGTPDDLTDRFYQLAAAGQSLAFTNSENATLVSPPQFAYKIDALPTSTSTETFTVTYTQTASKLLSTDASGSTIDATSTMVIEILPSLQSTLHLADVSQTSTFSAANDANTGLAYSSNTLTDSTVRNFFYAQKLRDAAADKHLLLASYINSSGELADPQGADRALGDLVAPGNLKDVTTNSTMFSVHMDAQKRFFGIELKDAAQEATFRSDNTVRSASLTLVPNGYTSGANKTLSITTMSAVNAVLREIVHRTPYTNAAATHDTATSVLVYDSKAAQWQTAVPHNMTTAYDGTQGQTYANAAHVTEDGATSALWVKPRLLLLEGGNAQVTDSRVTFNNANSAWSSKVGTTASAEQYLIGSTGQLALADHITVTLAAGISDLRVGQTVNYSGTGLIAGTTTIASITNATTIVLADAVTEEPPAEGEQQDQQGGGGNNVAVSMAITLQFRVQDAFCSKFYADSDKVKVLANPSWMENKVIDAKCTIAGASFRSVMNVGDTALEAQAAETGLDAANTLEMNQDTGKFTRTITIGMATPLEYNVSGKPSLVYHTDDSTEILTGTKSGKVRTMKVRATGSAETPVVAKLGIYTHEADGVLGNHMVLFTDKTDHRLNDAQGSAYENRLDLDTTPEASASTTADNDSDNDNLHEFVLTEASGKATLSLKMLSENNAFYRVKNEANLILADKSGVAVGQAVLQAGTGAAGKVVFVSTIGTRVRVEYTAFTLGADRMEHISFAAGALTIDGAAKTANSVEDLASNTHRRMRVVSSMHDGNFAIYAETDASEGEHNVDLMIQPNPYAAFTMGEHTVFDTTSGEYSNKNLGDVELGQTSQIDASHNVAVAYTGGENYTFTADWTNGAGSLAAVKAMVDANLADRKAFIVRYNTDADIVFLWRISSMNGNTINATLIAGKNQVSATATSLGESHLKLAGATALSRRANTTVALEERYDFLTMSPKISKCPRTAIPETPYSREFYFTDVDFALGAASGGSVSSLNRTLQEKFTPEVYIYRQAKELKSYSLTYREAGTEDGELVPAAIYSWDSDENSLITHDSAGSALVSAKRYLLLLVSHAGQAISTSAYNGFTNGTTTWASSCATTATNNVSTPLLWHRRRTAC